MAGRRLRIVFFGERSSTFSMLHYAALNQHPKAQVVSWVASPAAGNAQGQRARFSSPRDVSERLGMRLALEWQTLWHLRVPFALLNLHVPHARISKIRDDSALVGELLALQPDLLVSAGFRQILPPGILEIPRLGAFNCHPSPLPRYAGSNPWFWILSRGEIESAVTIHRMVAEVDAGDIVAQKSFPIGVHMNHQAFYNQSSVESALLLRNCVDHWAQGIADEHPQDLAQRTVFPAPRERDYQIDWTGSMRQITNLVRAVSPAPGASTTVRGQKLLVRRVVSEPSISAEPGTVVRMAAKGFVVACTDGGIRVAKGTVGSKQISGSKLAVALGICAGDRLVKEP